MMRALRTQMGAATLLMALVLMLAITIGTLGVARTLVVEQRMAANHDLHSRLFSEAETGMAEGLAHLTRSLQGDAWTARSDQHTLIEEVSVDAADPAIETSVTFNQPADWHQYLSVQARSRSVDNGNMEVGVSQSVRPLSVLTPVAESAPPLVLNGCLERVPLSIDIRPENADTAQAGASVWFNHARPCPALAIIDTHGGQPQAKALEDDLWPLVFSLSRQEFESLETEQGALGDGDRSYWLVQANDLVSGRWDRSLGSADRPVALYFPAATGCPQFSDGVRLYGLVFIDTECLEPIAARRFELYGTLIVNGDLNVGATQLRLNHIQLADARQNRLRFPILRSVSIPGSWKDF